MWQAVELRELRLFLTLAEELHFGRTAERLQLTPSRVSQSLRALEDKLGARRAPDQPQGAAHSRRRAAPA